MASARSSETVTTPVSGSYVLARISGYELRLQRGLRGGVEVGVALAGLALCPGVEQRRGFAVQPVGRPVGCDVAAVAPDRSELVAADRLPDLAACLDVGLREEGLPGHRLHRGRHGGRGEVDLAAHEEAGCRRTPPAVPPAPSTIDSYCSLLSPIAIADSPRHGAMVRPGAAVRLDRGSSGGDAEASTESPYGPCGDRGCIVVFADSSASWADRTRGVKRWRICESTRLRGTAAMIRTREHRRTRPRVRADGTCDRRRCRRRRPGAAPPTRPPATAATVQDPAARALAAGNGQLHCARSRAARDHAQRIRRHPGGRPANRVRRAAPDPDATPRQVARRGRAQRRRARHRRVRWPLDHRVQAQRRTSTPASRRSGTLDQALVYMVRDLHATMPLARMFTTEFPAEPGQARHVRHARRGIQPLRRPD